MTFVHIKHPDLGLEARVPASTARELARKGWRDATDLASSETVPYGPDRPSPTGDSHVPLEED